MGRGLTMGIFGRYRPQFSTEHGEAVVVEMWERENKCNRRSVLRVLLLFLQLQDLEERSWSKYNKTCSSRFPRARHLPSS